MRDDKSPPPSASGVSDEPLLPLDGGNWKHNCATDMLRIGRLEYPRLTWIAALERLGRDCGIIAPVGSSTASTEPSDDPEKQCAACMKPRREHRLGYSASRCAFAELTITPCSDARAPEGTEPSEAAAFLVLIHDRRFGRESVDRYVYFTREEAEANADAKSEYVDGFAQILPLFSSSDVPASDAVRAPSAQAHHGIGLRHDREPVTATPTASSARGEPGIDNAILMEAIRFLEADGIEHPGGVASAREMAAAIRRVIPSARGEQHDEAYWEWRTAQPGDETRTMTGDEWNVVTRLFHLITGDPLSPDQAKFARRCVEDLGEAEWRVRRDRDQLRAALSTKDAEIARLTATLAAIQSWRLSADLTEAQDAALCALATPPSPTESNG